MEKWLLAKNEHKRDRFILKRCFKNFNKSNFLEDLAAMRWEFVGCEGQNVHESANVFNKMFEECLNKHAPLKRIKIRPNYRRGLSDKTLDLRNPRTPYLISNSIDIKALPKLIQCQ